MAPSVSRSSTTTVASRRKPALSSSRSRSSSKKSMDKDVMFGSVEVIPDTPSALNGLSNRRSGSKLKRSPTPVLTSLTDLTKAHLTQLSSVWNEKNLPTFESDKSSIAATREGKDPFDF